MKPEFSVLPVREPIDVPPRYSFSPKVRLEVLLKSGGRCAMCAVKLFAVYDVDHILPRAHGGRNTIDNLQALCKPCHRDKTDVDIDQITKGNRQSKMGDPKPPSRINSPSFRSDLTKRFDGQVVKRTPKVRVGAEGDEDRSVHADHNYSSPPTPTHKEETHNG